MKKLSLVALTAGLLLSGCSVMHFKNGSVEKSGASMEKWHHNVAYSLYELGGPLNAASLCPETKNWSMITTKETFITGLAGGADDAVTAGLLRGAGGINIWDPQMVEYTCGK